MNFSAETKEKAGEEEDLCNKESLRQCPMWISLEVGYYFLLNINGEKTLLGDVRKKKKISALLKNEERGVRKPLPMGKWHPPATPRQLRLPRARNAPSSVRLEENVLQSH